MKELKVEFETKFSAIIKVGKITSTFHESCDSKAKLMKVLERNGMSAENIVKIKTHLIEKSNKPKFHKVYY